MIQRFDLDSKQIRIRDILTDKSFLEIEIFAISNAKPNRNRSYFTPESMEKGLKTFNDKPILGFFNSQNDFESHNGKVAQDPELEIEYWDNSGGEQILGFVRQSDQKEIMEREDGLLWIRCTAMICTQYNYKQVKRLLKDRKKKVSVEVSINKSETIDGIEYIYDFELMGITILGSRNGSPVMEGIEGAHLSVLDLMDEKIYEGQKQALVFMYSQLEENQRNKEDVDLATFEDGKALRVDKSKEAMSDTPWGSVDKTELRNRVVAASNFKEVAKDVFLDLREGWEDGETTKLKYPVMQIVDDDKLVYNRGALGSAKAYAEKNGEDEVLKKLKAIYEHLDLEFESEDKYECDEFCSDYEDQNEHCDCGCEEHSANEENFAGEGSSDNGDDGEDSKANDDDDDASDADSDEKDDEKMAAKTEETVDEEGKHCDPKKYTEEEYNAILQECDDLKMKCSELECKYNDSEENCRNSAAKLEELEAKNNELMAKVEDYDKIQKELEEANAKLEGIRINSLKSYIGQICTKYNLKTDEVNDLMANCSNGKYAANTDVDHDVAYLLFTKNQNNFNDGEHYNVGIDNITNKSKIDDPKRGNSILERLKSNI